MSTLEKIGTVLFAILFVISFLHASATDCNMTYNSYQEHCQPQYNPKF